MGLFDTIHLSEPLRLAECDGPVTEIQTKEFGSAMRDYFVGSVLDESPVLIGVVEESIWCEPREEGGEGKLHPVYLAIWVQPTCTAGVKLGNLPVVMRRERKRAAMPRARSLAA